MSTKETEKYLDAYKALETALRGAENSMGVLEYEDSLNRDGEQDVADKLKTCRIIRNYIQHHEDGKTLFPATGEMTRFIEMLTQQIIRQSAGVLEVMTKQKAVKITDDASTIAGILSKSKTYWVPVVNANNEPIGVITEKAFLQYMAKHKDCHVNLLMNAASIKAENKNIRRIPSNDRAKDHKEVDRYRYIVVGKTGKYKGVLI